MSFDFKKWVKSIQPAGYNGARSVMITRPKDQVASKLSEANNAESIILFMQLVNILGKARNINNL